MFKDSCYRCSCAVGFLDARRVTVQVGRVVVLCQACHALGLEYGKLRDRGLSDRQAWRRLQKGGLLPVS